jgi:hypothetical protein
LRRAGLRGVLPAGAGILSVRGVRIAPAFEKPPEPVTRGIAITLAAGAGCSRE